MEPITNPTDSAQQNPVQIPASSYSEIFTGERPNPSVERQQNSSNFFHQNKLKLKTNVYDYNINSKN